MLINLLLLHSTDTYWNDFASEIVRLSVPKAAVRFMCHLVDP